MKPLKRISILLVVVIGCLSSLAQDDNSTKSPDPKTERQIWIRLKSGPVLTGNLVKMDSDSVDFKVKGVLQSVKCDELIGVMFIPPTPKPAPAPVRTQQTPVPAPEKPQPEQTPAQLPDRCSHRSIQLAGGQYNHSGFSQSIRDFIYKGNFKVHGGKISMYITDAENYAKLINFKKFIAFHSLVNVTEGDFSVSLPKGEYHLTWWNESRSDTRLIEAEVCFSYPGQ